MLVKAKFTTALWDISSLGIQIPICNGTRRETNNYVEKIICEDEFVEKMICVGQLMEFIDRDFF